MIFIRGSLKECVSEAYRRNMGIPQYSVRKNGEWVFGYLK